MKQIKFAKKMKGFALSSELIFLSTIVTAGLSVGMVTVRDAVVAEMTDVSNAIGALNQSYEYNGVVNNSSSAAIEGSGFEDVIDTTVGDSGGYTFVVAGATETENKTVNTGTPGTDVGSIGTL
jgi:hypothetical protein